MCCIDLLVSMRFGIHCGKLRPCCSPYLKYCANLSARASPVKHAISSFQAFILAVEPTQLHIYDLNQYTSPLYHLVSIRPRSLEQRRSSWSCPSNFAYFTLEFWCRQAVCRCKSYFQLRAP